MEQLQTMRLQESPQATALLRLLLEAQRQATAQEYAQLLGRIDHLEGQLAAITDELREVKGILSEMQKSPVRQFLAKTARAIETQVQEAKEGLGRIKASITEGAAKAVADFKEKGATALDSAIDAIHLRENLSAISGQMEQSAQNARQSIDRITAASEEFQKMNQHRRNISRALTGKDRTAPANLQPGALAKTAMKPFASVESLCQGIKRQADALSGKLEQLSARLRKEEKPSIRQSLLTHKELPALPEKTGSRGKAAEAAL